MSKNDQLRLRHMLDSAREAVSFITGKSRADLETDRMLTLSLVKCIEIIGEAANSVSKEFREGHPEIPWQDIVGMRHRLIHAYYDVDLDVVWATVTEDLLPFIAELDKIISEEI